MLNAAGDITSTDVLVIGSGYGGLGAALTLVEQGRSVVLCEALSYPGGCASTFSKEGFQFEAGATLFSGFEERQLFGRWIKRHQMPVRFEPIDPPIEFRTETHSLPIFRSRERTLESFCALPGAPHKALRSFFAVQKKVADILWPVFDHPDRLPPFSAQGLGWHLKRIHRYPTLLPYLNRSLSAVLQRYKLSGFRPFVDYCNALSQITIQVSSEQAEAVFALATLDYPFRGTGHIHGGIGELSTAMLQTIEHLGGEIRMASRVRTLTRDGGGWLAKTRSGQVWSRRVVANMLPQDLAAICVDVEPLLQQQRKSVEAGWGAVMLYLVLRDSPEWPEHAHHIQAVLDNKKSFEEGNHIFCSISGNNEANRAPEGMRTATVSTHLRLAPFLQLSTDEQAQKIHNIQQRMLCCMEERLPSIATGINRSFPASPRTYQRFTRRYKGFVGGVPRAVGWHNYRGLWPKQIASGLWMVGDSIFPGQSTLATALGGARTARAVNQTLKQNLLVQQ